MILKGIYNYALKNSTLNGTRESKSYEVTMTKGSFPWTDGTYEEKIGKDLQVAKLIL